MGSELDRNGGVGPGFDILRIVLALGVVAWHQGPIMFGSPTPAGGPLEVVGTSVLPMFFGLSGFLVTASALRLSLGNFLVNRGLRIFPALIVEIVLSAFIIGPIFTNLPLGEYLSRRQTFHYLTNMVGWINYQLPGVFKSNPYDAVNWSLWTIPWELASYALVSGLILLGLLRRSGFVILVNLALVAATVVAAALRASPAAHGGAVALFARLFSAPGTLLVTAFIWGVILYLHRHRIPHSRWAAAAAAGLVALVALLPNARAMGLAIPLPFALVYLAAYFGVMRVPPLPILRRGDYSYGIYLYGAPVQQAVRAAFPTLNSAAGYGVLALAAIFAFAAFSWHCIEKPILRLRRRFSFVARQRGVGGPEPSERAARGGRAS